MSLTILLTFVLITAAQVAAPGPSTVFLVNNAITYCPRRAIVALSGDHHPGVVVSHRRWRALNQQGWFG